MSISMIHLIKKTTHENNLCFHIAMVTYWKGSHALQAEMTFFRSMEEVWIWPATFNTFE
jgi:hypothetical protein